MGSRQMTPRERILAAAKHMPVDKLPVMIWVEAHAAVKTATRVVRPKKLTDRAFFDTVDTLQTLIPKKEIRNTVPLLASLVTNEYLVELGSDIVNFTWATNTDSLKGFRLENGAPVITDVYGAERRIMGLYLELTGHPCKTPEDLDAYVMPELMWDKIFAGLTAFKKKHPDIAVSADCPGIQDVSQWFMGMENLYTWMALHPDKIKNFFEKMLDHSLKIIRSAMKAGADVVLIYDDYGAQNRLLISKKMWEKFSYPCIRRQCEEVHKHGGLVMLHSCGYVQPLLDRIVDAGVDMIQSFQQGAGNDLASAKKEFGDKICFVTGMDSQMIPAMTPAEVRESIISNARTGRIGGGFVLGTNHAIQVDTPVENLKALFDTIKIARELDA